MRGKTHIKVRFTQSGCVISGIAFKEREGILASFKMNVEGGNLAAYEKPLNTAILKVVFNKDKEEAYDFFRRIFLGDGKTVVKHVVLKDESVEFHLELSRGELKNIVKRLKTLASIHP